MKDIPSSNFVKKDAKKIDSNFAKKFYKNVTSIPDAKPTHKNPEGIFDNIALPDKYKSLVQKHVIQKKQNIQKIHENKPIFEQTHSIFQQSTIHIEETIPVMNLDVKEVEDPAILKAQISEMLKFKSKYKSNISGKKGLLFDQNIAKAPKAKKIEAFVHISTPQEQMPNVDNPEENISEYQASNQEPIIIDENLPFYDTPFKDIEWWDEPFMNIISQIGEKITPELENSHNFQLYIKNLIPENLTSLPNCLKKSKTQAIKLLPTRDELRKHNKKKRLEKQLKIQEEVKYGLRPAPENKMKLSNFHRILGSTISNPTELEQMVRKQIDNRQQKHLKHNEERKLTAETKKQKRIRKIRKDSGKSIIVTIFLIPCLSNYEHQYILTKNIKQYFIKGFAVVSSKECKTIGSVVVIEAGPGCTEKIKKLILSRIKWSKDELSSSVPVVLWQGKNEDHLLTEWKIVKAKNNIEYTDLLEKHGFQNFVNQILNYKFN